MRFEGIESVERLLRDLEDPNVEKPDFGVIENPTDHYQELHIDSEDTMWLIDMPIYASFSDCE